MKNIITNSRQSNALKELPQSEEMKKKIELGASLAEYFHQDIKERTIFNLITFLKSTQYSVLRSSMNMALWSMLKGLRSYCWQIFMNSF